MALEQVGVEATLRGFNEYVRQIRELVKETQKAGGSLESTASGANKAGTAVDKAGRSFGSSAKQVLQFGAAIAGVQLGVAGIQSAFGNTIGAAIKFEQAFTGVVKTVDATDAQLATLEKGIRQLAKETPIAATELANVASAAGQLGIATDDILGFTKIVADLGVATNLGTEEAAFALARFSNITGLATDELDNMGSAIVDLGNNSATTERDIVEFALRIAGAGTQIGLTQAETLAFGAALSSVGLDAEAGGTAISRVFVEVDKAVRTGSDSLDLFAQVAGMSAQEFARAYEQDAAGAIVTFIEGLKNVSETGGDTFGILEDLEFGNIRVRDALLRASNAGDLLRESLSRGNQAWEENTALTKEAELFYGTTENQLKLLKNQIVDAGISLGNVFLPAINDGIGFLGDFVEGAREGEGAAGLLADVLPSIAVALGAIVAVKAAFAIFELADAAADAAFKFSNMQLALGGIVGAFVALDTGLRAVTGEGLVERVVELFRKTDRAAQEAAESFERYADARDRALGGSGDPDARAQEFASGLSFELRGLNQELLRAERLGDAYGNRLNETGRAAEAFGGRVAGLVLNLQESGASSVELSQFIGSLRVSAMEVGQQFGLTDEQLAHFVDTVVSSATDQIPKWNDVAQHAATTADYLAGRLDSGAFSMANMGEAQDAVAGKLQAAGFTIENKTAPAIQTFIDKAFDAAKKTYDWDAALNQLSDTFSRSNPAYQSLVFEMAVLNEELDDIKLKGDAATAAEKERARVIEEELLPPLKSQKDAFDSNGKAADEMQGHLENLMGPEGYGGLRVAMDESGRSQESQITLQKNISDAYGLLADKDIPGAIEAFGRLKEVMSPSEWEVLAQTVGPAILTTIQEGLTDPQAIADAIDTARGLGLPIAEGLAAGLLSSETESTIAAAGSQAFSAGLASAWDQAGPTIAADTEAAVGDIPSSAKSGVENADWSGVGDAFNSRMAAQVERLDVSSAVSSAATRILGSLSVVLGGTFPDGVAEGIEKGNHKVHDAAVGTADAAIEGGRYGLNARSPSVRAKEEIGEAYVDGVVLGIEEGTPRAELASEQFALAIVQGLIGGLRASDMESAMQGFMNSLSIETGFDQLEAQFGEAGGDVAIAFTRALADNTERSGEQLTKTVLSLIEAANEAGVPNAQALGENLVTAITEALRTGEPALVQQALDMLDRFTTTIEVAAQGAGVSLIDSFLEGYNTQVRDRALVESVGKTGADIIKGLRDGLEKESPTALNRVGVLADGIVQELKDRLGDKKAAEPARILMDAIATAIREGTPEAEAALVEVLTILDDVLEGNFGSLRDLAAESIPGAVTTGINQGKPKTLEAAHAFGSETLNFFYQWQIDLNRGLAEGTAMSTETIYEGLMNMKSAILESGLDDEAKNLATGIIDGFITSLEDGKGLANEALLAFIGELLATARSGDPDSSSAGSGEGSGSGGGSGSAPASNRGQTFREQAETILGFNPFAKEVVPTGGGFSETVYTEGSLRFASGGILTEGDLMTRLVRGDLIDWIEDGRITVNKYDRGTPFVPQDQLALVHRGEAIIPEAYNPWAYLPARGDVGGGGGGNEITINIDLSGAQFTGTPEENEAMMRTIFRDEMNQQLGNGAFLHGIRG